MAAERPKRSNAGNKMGKLIKDEIDHKDEFYATAYGGFDEASGDDEYEVDIIILFWTGCGQMGGALVY